MRLITQERSNLFLGGVISLVLLISGFVLFPSLARVHKLGKKIAIRQKEWAELRKMVEEHRRISTGLSTEQMQSLIPFLEELAKNLGIKDKISYVKPYGDRGEGAEIKFEDITGEELVKILFYLQRSRIDLKRLQARDYEQDGYWVIKIFAEG